MNTLSSTTSGSHGDHWSALFGSQNLHANPDTLMSRVSMWTQEVGDTSDYVRLVKNLSDIDASLIAKQGSMQTCYPVLPTHHALPIVLNEVTEWSHVDNIEAYVGGKGKGQFALCFFATDYLENKETYKNSTELNIALSAFAYGMKEYHHDPERNFGEQFVCYLPHTNSTYPDVYSCVGEVEFFSEYNFEEIHGYIARLILVRDGDIFFALDVFIHKDHLISSPLRIGMKLTGNFWLQGKIAE